MYSWGLFVLSLHVTIKLPIVINVNQNLHIYNKYNFAFDIRIFNNLLIK